MPYRFGADDAHEYGGTVAANARAAADAWVRPLRYLEAIQGG